LARAGAFSYDSSSAIKADGMGIPMMISHFSLSGALIIMQKHGERSSSGRGQPEIKQEFHQITSTDDDEIFFFFCRGEL
jgi:hypothetical protein